MPLITGLHVNVIKRRSHLNGSVKTDWQNAEQESGRPHMEGNTSVCGRAWVCVRAYMCVCERTNEGVFTLADSERWYMRVCVCDRRLA